MKITIPCFLLFFIINLLALPSQANASATIFKKSPTATINKLANNDAVIISESNDIEITGLKAEFINFSITKKMKLKILNTKGVKKYSKFILPEEFDPGNILHFPKERNYTYVFSKLKCNYFKGTITNAKGETKVAKISQSIEPVKMVMVENNYYGNFEKYNYKIENLEVGDLLCIEYNYFVPYADNFGILSSFRIFFNTDIPKENYQLSLSHETKLNIDIFFKNNANPDSTITRENKKYYYWNKNNLAGCINEEGSIPYLSLP